MEKVKKKKKTLYLLLFLIIFGGILGLLINYFSPYYKIESRVKETKKFTGINNEKALGWLRVQGTNIDFPIVYYDDTDVSDPTNELGWSYADDRKLTKKVTLFSHNVLNVSSNPLIGDENHKRFEQLMAFIYTDFVEENKYIQYTVNDKDYLYKIYAISFQKEDDIDYENNNPSTSEMKSYINKAIKNSYFEFDVDVDKNDKLITLVTCTRFFGQTTEYSFVVDARMVRDNEIIKNYDVTEKKSYNKIKKIMEGDAEDAEL